MMEVIRDANKLRLRSPRKSDARVSSRAPAKNKRIKRKPLIKKSKISLKAKKKYPRKLPIKPARKSLPAKSAPLSIKRSFPPPPKSGIGKTTKLKSSDRSDLAIPAFGYIDVCFCVDATGSMSSEIAQVQSTI